MSQEKQNCQVCGSTEWWDLPNPTDVSSITTAGRIVDEPLGKAQCSKCGFVQRIHAQFLGLTDYYEQDYAKYYDRPGTTQFHRARYRVLAEWMASVLGSQKPARILDVGCGQGWAMEAMKTLYPNATIEGLEPSHYNSSIAREKGFVVYENRAAEASMPLSNYDLVYTNNVIQHVTNAREFVTSLKEMAGEDGIIVITCPDGSLPNIELLWSDQNFSFLPPHVIRLCQKVGFDTLSWFPSPPSPSVPPAQMLLLSKTSKHLQTGMTAPEAKLEDIYEAKCDYLNSFRKIDEYLCSRAKDRAKVVNFGASYWSSILAAYCPNYWQAASACVVEEAADADREFLGKPVVRLADIAPKDRETMVLGTSPATHKALAERFSTSWKNIISWDTFLRY